MRHILLVLALITGCSQSVRETSGVDSDGGPSADLPPECHADPDCVLAAPTCCQCPTFAVTQTDPLHQACEDVGCSAPSCPDNVSAICSPAGRCELACMAMACPVSCETGFVVDANGCLTCACAAAVPGGCQGANQCVEAPADCCGCARGGVDTAVLAALADAHQTGLMCPAMPQCPGGNTCETGATPQCVEGRCLLSSGTLPANACGRPDLPACPADQMCLVNADAAATQEGVGVCGPA